MSKLDWKRADEELPPMGSEVLTRHLNSCHELRYEVLEYRRWDNGTVGWEIPWMWAGPPNVTHWAYITEPEA